MPLYSPSPCRCTMRVWQELMGQAGRQEAARILKETTISDKALLFTYVIML
ncbi:hypothetical protein ACFSC6_21520 [Rufibacter sediminis]|uniref:Uncharacterized protein n=1 Tax=Rufibacter sediminis TaxID=2762756 RepID=A0ABR6VRE1_9BACT|nr:hypothetical protein [Rufibacter sediminis]MBC3539711.1 hypothetical protein [Rufibacter sediminis]